LSFKKNRTKHLQGAKKRALEPISLEIKIKRVPKGGRCPGTSKTNTSEHWTLVGTLGKYRGDK